MAFVGTDADMRAIVEGILGTLIPTSIVGLTIAIFRGVQSLRDNTFEIKRLFAKLEILTSVDSKLDARLTDLESWRRLVDQTLMKKIVDGISK